MTAISGDWIRGLRLSDAIIKKLSLDLTGKTVLTEVGSNAFMFTPLIALKANAEKVWAWCKDTRYGKAEGIIENCKALISYAALDESKIIFEANADNIEHLASADIITNSGFLRPLTKDKLQHVKETAVIPVMYEKWELRASDIDVEYCKQRNLKVAGTWENYPGLEVFDYCEQLIVKLALESGVEIKNNKIIIWSSDQFGEKAESGFLKLGAAEIIKTTSSLVVNDHIHDCDLLLFCDYTSDEILIGESGVLDVDVLHQKNPSLLITHLCGNIDISFIPKEIKVYPAINGSNHKMTFTLAHLGIDPTIRLLAAGLKVGELLSNNTYHNHSLVQLI
jgi:hypothetical protein